MDSSFSSMYDSWLMGPGGPTDKSVFRAELPTILIKGATPWSEPQQIGVTLDDVITAVQSRWVDTTPMILGRSSDAATPSIANISDLNDVQNQPAAVATPFEHPVFWVKSRIVVSADDPPIGSGTIVIGGAKTFTIDGRNVPDVSGGGTNVFKFRQEVDPDVRGASVIDVIMFPTVSSFEGVGQYSPLVYARNSVVGSEKVPQVAYTLGTTSAGVLVATQLGVRGSDDLADLRRYDRNRRDWTYYKAALGYLAYNALVAAGMLDKAMTASEFDKRLTAMIIHANQNPRADVNELFTRYFGVKLIQ